jgi:hypothetical protein
MGQVLTNGYSRHAPSVYEELANLYQDREHFLYLGRGVNYPIALEGALKLKEISYIHAEGYPAGEMKHGPIALIDDRMPVVAIAPRDSIYDKMVSQIEQVKARGGIVIAVATEGDEAIRRKADHVLYVPETAPLLTPVLTVLQMQLLAYHVAIRRGCDVDQFLALVPLEKMIRARDRDVRLALRAGHVLLAGALAAPRDRVVIAKGGEKTLQKEYWASSASAAGGVREHEKRRDQADCHAGYGDDVDRR